MWRSTFQNLTCYDVSVSMVIMFRKLYCVFKKGAVLLQMVPACMCPGKHFLCTMVHVLEFVNLRQCESTVACKVLSEGQLERVASSKQLSSYWY